MLFLVAVDIRSLDQLAFFRLMYPTLLNLSNWCGEGARVSNCTLACPPYNHIVLLVLSMFILSFSDQLVSCAPGVRVCTLTTTTSNSTVISAPGTGGFTDVQLVVPVLQKLFLHGQNSCEYICNFFKVLIELSHQVGANSGQSKTYLINQAILPCLLLPRSLHSAAQTHTSHTG